MAINPTMELVRSAPQFLNQTYTDLTFVLGPPHGERYETLVNAARLEKASFSSVYQKYIEAMFTALDSEGILNEAVSAALGVDTVINDIYLTYQFWTKPQEKHQKFYLFDNDANAQIPAVMLFPPKLTLTSGAVLDVDVTMEHAHVISLFLAKSLTLDWIDISATLAEQGGVDHD